MSEAPRLDGHPLGNLTRIDISFLLDSSVSVAAVAFNRLFHNLSDLGAGGLTPNPRRLGGEDIKTDLAKEWIGSVKANLFSILIDGLGNHDTAADGWGKLILSMFP